MKQRGARQPGSSTSAGKSKGKGRGKRTEVESLEPRVMMSVTDAAEHARQQARGMAASLSAGPEMAQTTWNLVLVDASLARRGLMPATDAPGTRVVLLDDSNDIVTQITRALESTGKVRSLHLITHGQSGAVTVGEQAFDADLLARRGDEVAKWSNSLTDDAVIALYGCDVAEGASGRAFVQALAKRSGATVAASDDLTGAAARGGDWKLEYVSGDDAVRTMQFAGFDGLLATFTVTASGGTAAHVVGTGASVVDGSVIVSSSDAVATYTSATVSITGGYRTGEDVLALPGAPAGFTPVFNAGTGVLTVTAAGGKTAAEFQAALRLVTYNNTLTTATNLSTRGVTFSFGGVSSAKALAPDLPVDSKIQDRIKDAFHVIDKIGQAIVAGNAEPYRNDTTEIPVVGSRITDLLYPNSPNLDSNGNAVADLSRSIQPKSIGSYIQLESTVNTYFTGAGTSITNLNGLQTALESYLDTNVQGNKSVVQVDAAFTKPAATDAGRRIDLTVTILTAKGDEQPLQIETLARELNMKFGSAATVEVGGGADIAFTISIDLAGHTYGVSATTVAAGNVGINFSRLNAFAGYTVGSDPFDVTIGAIGGTVTGASGYLGARIPVNLGGGGNTRTLGSWATDGSDYAGFGTMTGSASITLPISAGIGGVSATTANTRIVFTDANLFDSVKPTYVATDFGQLQYFAGVRADDIINQVLKVGDLFNALDNSSDRQFGVYVPTLDDTTLGDLFDFKSMFDEAIGSKIDIYEPVLNSPGRDELTDYRLPLSDDSTPKGAMWSDLRAGFTFGVVINESWPVHTVTVAANDARTTLDDLVTHLNAALTTAGLDLVASNVKNKISIKASDIAVQRFAVVPIAPAAGRLSPTAPPSDLSTLTQGTAYYYTVTGSTTGSITGTNYYTVGSTLAKAAVHAGILDDGETGVVKVTRVGNKTDLIGSDRNDVVSADGSGDSYLIESAASDLRRLGLVDWETELAVLESLNGSTLRATLPLQANLSASASFKIVSGGSSFTINLPDNGRTDVRDTLGDLKSAMATAGVGASTLGARLVDAQGNVFDVADEPEANTGYYLQFYIPDGSAWTTFKVAPKSEETAHQVLPLGFLVGDTAARPRPAGLASFDDFADADLFPGLSVSPVYDPNAGTVTLEFTASQSASPSVKAAFDLVLGKLGKLKADNENLAFTPVVNSQLSFGLQFKIGPEKPISLPSGNTLPTNGRLTGAADFSLNFVLQDKYAISVPQAWTTSNDDVQELIADVNRAFKQTTNGASQSEDITDRFIARRVQGDQQMEMTTAVRANAGSPYTLGHTHGVLDDDVQINFWHDGESYAVTLAAADTEDNATFGDLVLQLNNALATATNGDGEIVALSGSMFFTTIAGANGAANSDVYLYATTPADDDWPASIVLTAARTNKAVTELGYDDSGDENTDSVLAARSAAGDATLVEHSNGKPLASGTVDITFPSFSGSVPYGFNTLDFDGASGGVTAAASVELIDQTSTVDQVASNLANKLDQTLTRANGTGKPRAALVLNTITSGTAAIDPAATIDITIADISKTTVIANQPIGVPIPVAGHLNGKLTADRTINFLYEGSAYAVTVTVAESSANTTFNQLIAQFNAKLAAASKTTGGVVETVDVSDQFTIAAAQEANQVEVTVATPTANRDFATVAFLPGINAFGEIAAQGSFGLSTVADSLMDVIPLLDALQSDLDLFSAFKLPLVDLKVNELIDIKGELLTKVEALRDVTISGPSQIAAAVSQVLGIPSDHVAVMYDDAASAYRIDIQWETGIATGKALDLTLADFYRFTGGALPNALSSFRDTSFASPLDIKIKAVTTLALGIDLTNPDEPRTFLYGHDGTDDMELSDGTANGTSVKLEVEAKADDISFTAALGAFGIFVRGGSAHLGGAARTFGSDPIYTFDEKTRQLHYARDAESAVLAVKLGEAGEKYYLDAQPAEEDAYDTRNYETSFDGTVEANLPLFTPTEFINPFIDRTQHVRIEGQGMQTVNPAGNIFQLFVPDLQKYADSSLHLVKYQRQISDVYALADGNPLTVPQQQVVNDLQTLINGLKSGGALSIFTPDVDSKTAGIKPPTLLDLVRDPAILVDGIDVALGSIETGLRALDNLNIPLIGSVLGNAVDGVFNWRKGWLLDLKHDLRGQGEAFFETLKGNVYDFLGPAGLDILLKDNGVRSVDGMIKADSKDDVTLDFLDKQGKKMTGLGGYGAEAMEFKVRLGQVLLDTGVDVGFNFDALQPAFSLKLEGGLTFKLGWDMTIGFGVSLKDGFYVVTDSDPVANELELRFEAGLSGRQTGFSVRERAGSISGYSIVDAAGQWVYGPRKGDGSTSILDVMPVDVHGNDYDFSQGLPPSPEDCAMEVAAGNPQPVYWVVAMNDGTGHAEPAYLDKLGQYRAMAGDDWSDVNGGDDARNPDLMVQFDQTAPFAAFGSLFAFNLSAIDNIKMGLQPLGDAEYFYDGTKLQVTANQRNHANDGVNRNNNLPTRIAGRIGVNIVDPSAKSKDYDWSPGPTPTGFMLLDHPMLQGGKPILDPRGELIPVKNIGGNWYVMKALSDDPNPAMVADFLMNQDRSPNRITFNEIRQAGTSIFEIKLNAEAVLNLKIALSISDKANIPRITAELNIDWRTDSMKPPENPFGGSEEQKRDLVPEFGVNNIRLDLGTFLTQFIKPIANKIDGTMKPLDPLIDVLTAALPVLSDIAGRDITLSTLLTNFGGPKGQAVAAVIDLVKLVRDLAAVMNNTPNDMNVYLPIGNFWLAKVGAGPFGRPGLGTQIYYDNSEVKAPSITQRNQSMIADGAAAANKAKNLLGKLDAMDKGTSSQPGVAKVDRGGFSIPILQDPMTVFKLMMGQDVPLVTFSLPKLDFNFSTDIPLAKIVILNIGLRFNLQMKGQLAVGYDTYGIRLFGDSHDPADLLEGFYVSDRANADGTGADVDEFYLRATIALYGEIDLYLAKAGIEGGFTFTASINLNDPDNDGKLRVMEAVDLVKYTGNPLDLADLHFSGEIYAKYYYWVGLKIWTPWKTYKITLVQGGKTFARMTVFSFTREGRDGPPVLGAKVTTVLEDGTEQPNSLLLNFGPNSAKRISNEDPLKLKDAAEHVKIRNVGSTVYVQYVNYSNKRGQVYETSFTGISRVVVHGGEGNDTIDASGLDGIPVEFDGGAGNDTILLGSGSTLTESIIKGGLGNDVISVSNGGKMRLEGDEGDDQIAAGTNAYTTIDGGGGNDTLTGGGGSGGQNTFKFTRSFGKDNLILNSAALVNLLDFIDSSLPLTAQLKSLGSVVKAGDTNSATFDFSKVTEIRGSDGRDTFNVTDPTTRSANNGKGVVLAGGPSDDTYNINADDVTAMNADGITIDDDIEPLVDAVAGDVVIDECGCIKKIKMANMGLGYVQPPDVIIQDPGGGIGARAVASIDRNGRVTGIYVLAKGDNYSPQTTVTLVRNISTGDKINFNAQGQHTVAMDRQGNGGGDSQLKINGKTFKWIGNNAPGVIREKTYDVNEIDKVSINLPNAKLEINDATDISDKFEVTAKEFDQRAPITADTVVITTDRGFAADYPINATNNGDVTLRVTGKVDANDITTQAIVTANVVGGVITGFNIVSGGSGYKFAPTLIIEDPRGAAARATTTITNGVVTAINLIDGGEGYLTTPAPVVKVAHPDSIQLNNNLSTSTVGSLPGDGDGRGTVTLRAENGAINSSGDVFFPDGSKVEFEHGDYRYTSSKTLRDITPTVYPATVGGMGAVAHAVLDADGRVTSIAIDNPGSGYARAFLPSVQIEGAATATAIVDDNTGQITGFKITYPGEGYSSAPKVKIVSNGFGKLVGEDAGATEANRKHIKSAGGSLIATAYSGIGSSSKPLKTDVENMVAQTFDDGSAIYVLEKDGVRIGEMQHINGINTVNGNIAVTTFGGAISLGQPVQEMNASGELLWQDANKTIPIYAKDDTGKIIYRGGKLQAGDAQIKLTADDIDVNSFVSAQGGQLVLQPVQPDAVIGLNGTRARATLAINGQGQVTGTSELWSGRGYNALPTITIGAPGERAFGVANVLNGQLKTINVTFGGTNYNAQFPPTITLTGGGLNGGAPTTPATVVPVYTDGVVTGVTITHGGAGYYTAPTVEFALPGVQATATSQIINGKISEIQITNPGSNYQVAPNIEIAAPNDFTLEKEEVEYFQDGFGNILIGREDGRHVFYSADAGFVDGVTLRGPREGGTVELENIRSNNGPVVIVGSGHTLNMTSNAPAVSGTFVEIDDNIVVHNGVNATITATSDYVSIFGAGKGKIDGVVGSTSENLTITDVGNVLVTGAIGSTNPIHNLTINSTGGGTINLQQSVTLEGDLHIVKGGDINLGGNVAIGGNLIIDEGASISFAGTVTVGGNIVIRRATTVTFAKNVSAGGSVGIGEPNDPTAVEGVNFASTARLDVAGTVDIFTTDAIVFGNRIGQLTQPAGMTLRSDLSDISFQASVNVSAGEIEIRKARDITFAQEVNILTLDIQDATGQTRFERASVIGTMDVISTSLVQIKNRLDITTGSATLTTNDVDFAGGNGSINYLGGGVAALTIRPRTLSRDITIGSPPGVFSSLDISDVDLAAIGATWPELAIGNSAAGTGAVTIGSIGSQQGAGNSQLVTSTRIHGGSINVVQAIDSAAQAGFLKLVARTGNITIGARINGTPAERNAEIELQTLAGAVLINQPVHATDALRIFSATAVTEGASGYVDVPNLAVSAGGAITMTHASNNVSQIAMNSSNNTLQFRNDTAFAIGTVDVVSGLNSGTADSTLISVGGAVTQTQPITAAGLLLQGTGGTWTFNHAANDIDILAADTQAVSFTDADDIAVGTVGAKNGIATVGNTGIVAGIGITLSQPIITTTGNIVLDANNGSITAGANGDLTAGGTITLDATDDITLDDVSSGGALTANAENAFTANGNITVGGPVILGAADGAFAQASGTTIVATGPVTITASQSVTTRTINAAGNVEATAGTGVSVRGAITTTNNGNIALIAQDGNVDMNVDSSIQSAGTATLTASDHVITDAIHSVGALTVTAGGKIDSNDNVTTSGPVDINANSGAFTMANATKITAGGAMTVDATAEILAIGLASAGDMTLSGGGVGVYIGNEVTTTAGGNLTVNAPVGALVTDPSAVFTIAGAMDVDAYASVTLPTVAAVNNIDVNAGTTIVMFQPVSSSAGAITMDAASGDLTMGNAASITSHGATTLTSSADIRTQNVSAGGALTATASNALNIAGQLKTTNGAKLTVTAASGAVQMASGATIDADGDTEITAATNATTRNVAAAGDVAVTAGSTVSILGTIGTTSDGHISIEATNGPIVMALSSAIDADGDAALVAGTYITAADVVADLSVTMTAGTYVSMTGSTVTTSGPVAIEAQGGAVTMVEGTHIASGGAVTIDASTDISSEQIAALGNVTFRAGDGVAVNGPIGASNGGTIDLGAADGSIAIAPDATLEAAGNVILSASDDVITAAITATDVTITATDSVTIADDLAAGDDVSITTTSGPITVALGATIGAGGDVTMQSGGLMQTRIIEAAGAVLLKAKNGLALFGNVTTHNGAASFISQTGSLSMAQGTEVVAGGAATFSVVGSYTLQKVTAKSIAASGSLASSLNGQLTTSDSGAISLSSGESLTFYDGGNIVSDGVVTVTAFGGIISYADFATTGDRINIQSPLTLADNVSMTSGRKGDGTITFAGTINGGKSLSLRSALDVAFNGAVGQTTALSGLHILSARNVSMPVRILADRIEQQAGTGTTDLSGSIAALGSAGMSIKAENVRVSGSIGTAANGAPLNLEAGALRVTRTGRITAGGRANFTADALVTDDGARVNVNNGAALVLTADALTLNSRADSLAGTGVVVLQPLGTTTPITIGATGAAFDLTQKEIDTLAVGFSEVIVGRGQDAKFDSGSTGASAVTVGNASFRAPVTIRSAGAAGSIKVDGTLSTQGRMSHITLTAGGDVAVNGAVKVGRSGHIIATADADSDRRGAVRVAESTNATVTTPSGNILLIGPAVRVGGTKSFAQIVSGNSSVFIGTTASQSTAVITNPKTTIEAKDFLVGGSGRVNPALVHLEGNVIATEDFNLYADGDIEVSDARIIGEQSLSLIARNDVKTSNVSLIGRRGVVSIRPDADKDGRGTPVIVDTRVSQPSPLDLRARIGEVRMPVTIVPGSRGEAFVVVGNNTRQTVSGLVTVYLYASTDDTLDATDRVIGTTRARITLAPAGSQTFRVRLALPANLATGQYKLIAEAAPYANQVSTVGSNIGVGSAITVTAA